ncbi:MAG: PD-(D/E)XK nuclease family protein, partial [Anaerolineales bacterium]|nr:PD-(D/E)XK nuclease family protein [Anaerolineales bacterium]
VLATPLDATGLKLETIAWERRINELEFYYPVVELRAAALRQLLKRYGYDEGPFRGTIDRLEFSPLRGYMKGFIDLVFESGGRFYLVDYKSNWLGADWSAYRSSRLYEEMARETYFLQYLIYTLALHRYLRLRVKNYNYEQHLGKVFYLFLRGIDPNYGPEFGIFTDRPPYELVVEFDQLVKNQ